MYGRIKSNGAAFAEMIGAKINRILIEEGEETLVFETDQGDFVFRGEGDCCSETWFADLEGFEALSGGVLRKVEEIEQIVDVVDGRTRQEMDEIYGIKLLTDLGMATLTYRNSSNGYYCGEAILDPQAEKPSDLREIKDDWSG